MDALSRTLQKRFELAFNASAYSSRRKLSEDSGSSPARAGKIMSGDFAKSKDGPGVFGLWRMAEKMDVTLNDLLPPELEVSERPRIQDFFSKYRAEGAKLSDFEELVDFCDIYDEPKSGRSRILKVGPRSALAERTNLKDAAIHQLEYDGWSKERKTQIYSWQRRAWEQGVGSEVEYFSASFLTNSRNVAGPILKGACRVVDNSEDRLLVYVEQLW